MRIALGSDHRGFELKARLCDWLSERGHEPLDVGPHDASATDYPLHAAAAARAVAAGEARFAVVVCGSGVGVSIAANKVAGARAVNAHDPLEAELARRHNDANVLALGAARLDEREARTILDAFLAGAFEGGRHARRVGQIAELEAGAASVPVAA